LDQAAIVLEELTITAAASGQGESITPGHAMEKRGPLEGPLLYRRAAPRIEEGWELISVTTD
jgi:hypothetical protein